MNLLHAPHKLEGLSLDVGKSRAAWAMGSLDRMVSILTQIIATVVS